jgi:iduronate 2-sulfatase
MRATMLSSAPLMNTLPRLLAFLIFICVTASAAPQPNVLFIVADDFRAELASYGSPAKTPNLDRLAKRSLQFDRAYAQQAVCNPSRSSFLTGRRPDTLRIWNNGTHFRELNPDVTTLPLWFKEHGYDTRCVGKIFHNWHTKVHGDPRSWSAPEFLHFANHGEDDAQVKGELPPNFAKTTTGFGYAKNGLCECRDLPDEAYFDGRVAAEAVRVLAEVKGKPFFLAVGFWKPHAPFNAPKKYWDLYDRAKLPPLDAHNAPRPEGAPDIAFHQSTEILGPVKNQQRPTPEQAAEMRHGYFANISYMDAQLGKVLDALDASGVMDRTIVTFVADHGYHIGEHTLWGKTSNFELDARVPFFISAPVARAIRPAGEPTGSERTVRTMIIDGKRTTTETVILRFGDTPEWKSAGQRTSSPTELLDLFPTLTALCGLPKPDGLEGMSLVPLLADPSLRLKPASFTQHPRPAYYDREPGSQPSVMGVSVRTARVRYTEWRDWKTGEPVARELYDDTGDPNEMHNVVDAVDSPALAEAQTEAAALLRKQFPVTRH